MTKRVIQTSPDIGLTIRLPKRQTVVQQVGTVAPANPGAPVWLGWQGEGGEACARLIYPCAIPPYRYGESVNILYANIPPWPYPQAWLAGVPPQDKRGDDWRVVQTVTWTARAQLALRVFDLDAVPNLDDLTDEIIERDAVTVWEDEIDLDVLPPPWPELPRMNTETGENEPLEPDESACCIWTAPPEGLPLVPPRDIAPSGRQMLRIAPDDVEGGARLLQSLEQFDFQEFAQTEDGNQIAAIWANLPAIAAFDRAGVLLVSTSAYAVLPNFGMLLDTDLTCTAHDADGAPLGEVSLHLPVIHFKINDLPIGS